MPVLTARFTPDIDALCVRLRIGDPSDRARLAELAGEAAKRPGGAVYAERRVTAIRGDTFTIAAEAGEVTFAARPLARLFHEGMAVYPFVATCGPAMAAYGETLSDPLEQYWWDALMLGAVAQAGEALKKAVGSAAGWAPVTVAPGSIRLWPISNQPALFSLIGDVKEAIGVTLAESHLMVPLKSISGIHFQGHGEFSHKCALCSRDSCQGRAAPYDPELTEALEGDMFSVRD